MNSTHTLWYGAPAAAWTQALPLGNGRLGAMVFGGPLESRFQLNEDSLWSGLPHAYTVPGAKEALARARALLAEKYPERLAALCQKCGMTEAEFGRIEEASRKMYFPYNEEYGMYMQDDNFMYKDPVDLASVPAEKLPLLFTLHPLNLWRWQVCKQADIVLLTFLCSEFFDKEQIRKIFDYYEPKTIHDSSLSAAVHSIVACAIGYRGEAYSYLKHAARMDLDDVNGNTAAGLHAACMGGAWMLIVNGYAGLRVYGGTLHFDPMLDDKWKVYSFKIHYHGLSLIHI